MEPEPKNLREGGIIHDVPFEKYPRFCEYSRLEAKRILSLNLKPEFARLWDVRRYVPLPVKQPALETICSRLPAIPMEWDNSYELRNKVIIGNTFIPWATMQRKVCGYGYDDEGDYRRKVSVLQAVDLVRWRPKPEFLRYRDIQPKTYNN